MAVSGDPTHLAYDYRDLIIRELERRQTKHPLYSLRALARDIGIAPSRLSEAVNAVRGISQQAARRICLELQLDSKEKQQFLLSVAAQHARSRTDREKAASKLRQLLAAPDEPTVLVETMTGWVESAVLKMYRSGRDLADSEAVAARLRVPVFMVVNGMRFLSRLGFIEGVKGYRTYLKDRGVGRKLNIDYQQVLDKAGGMLGSEKKDGGLFDMEPLTISPVNLPQAQKIVAKMFSELTKLENHESDTRIYFAAFQLFPIERERQDD